MTNLVALKSPIKFSKGAPNYELGIEEQRLIRSDFGVLWEGL